MKAKKSTFKVKAKKTERSGGGGAKYLTLPDGISPFRLEEGTKKVNLDILPYVVKDKNHPDKDGEMAAKGELWYRRPYKLHQRIGADKRSYVCLQSFGKRCPICEYQKELFNTDKEAAVALYPKDRDLYAIKLDGEDEIHVWDMSQKLFHDVLVDELETDDSNEDFADLESGKTLSIKFGWKTLGETTFPEARAISFNERDEALDESILDEVPCLDECLQMLSYEELKDIFFEMTSDEDADDDDEDDEDETPARSKKSVAPATKKSSPPAKLPKEKKEDEAELDWDTLKVASFRRLGKLIKEVDLFIDVDDYDGDDEESVDVLRKDIADALSIEIPKPKSPRPEKDTKKGGSRPNNSKVRPTVEDEDEDEETPFKDTPKSKTTTKPDAKAAGKAEKSANKCPHGHKFGADFEKTEDCDSCDMWDDCFENRPKK